MAFIERLFCAQFNCSFGTWVPGRYTEVAFIQGWLLRGVPLYTSVSGDMTRICIKCAVFSWHVTISLQHCRCIRDLVALATSF